MSLSRDGTTAGRCFVMTPTAARSAL